MPPDIRFLSQLWKKNYPGVRSAYPYFQEYPVKQGRDCFAIPSSIYGPTFLFHSLRLPPLITSSRYLGLKHIVYTHGIMDCGKCSRCRTRYPALSKLLYFTRRMKANHWNRCCVNCGEDNIIFYPCFYKLNYHFNRNRNMKIIKKILDKPVKIC